MTTSHSFPPGGPAQGAATAGRQRHLEAESCTASLSPDSRRGERKQRDPGYPRRRAGGGAGGEKASGSRAKDFPSPADHTSASGEEELTAVARLRSRKKPAWHVAGHRQWSICSGAGWRRVLHPSPSSSLIARLQQIPRPLSRTWVHLGHPEAAELSQPRCHLLPHLASQLAGLLEPQDQPSPGSFTGFTHPSIPAGS